VVERTDPVRERSIAGAVGEELAVSCCSSDAK
jgi:hypothetical protein